MSMMECRRCHRIEDARRFQMCCDCGAPICDDCANTHRGLCLDCDDRAGRW